MLIFGFSRKMLDEKSQKTGLRIKGVARRDRRTQLLSYCRLAFVAHA